jgi:hypothetical protein
MTDSSQPVIRTTDEQSDGIPYNELPLAADWKLPAEKINRLQQASIERLVTRCKQAHYVDIVVRINGKYEVHQADWIKHLETK